jgi:hypothetical protein
MKRVHDENNKRIENLNRNKNRLLKLSQDNEVKYEEVLKKIENVKGKIESISKIVTIKEKEEVIAEAEEEEEDPNQVYEEVVKNGKKVFRIKNK